MSADVIVLTGPPGAGKSTTAPELARRYDRAVVDAISSRTFLLRPSG